MRLLAAAFVSFQILLRRQQLKTDSFDVLSRLLHRHLDVMEPQDLARLARFLVCLLLSICCLLLSLLGLLSVSFLPPFVSFMSLI